MFFFCELFSNNWMKTRIFHIYIWMLRDMVLKWVFWNIMWGYKHSVLLIWIEPRYVIWRRMCTTSINWVDCATFYKSLSGFQQGEFCLFKLHFTRRKKNHGCSFKNIQDVTFDFLGQYSLVAYLHFVFKTTINSGTIIPLVPWRGVNETFLYEKNVHYFGCWLYL